MGKKSRLFWILLPILAAAVVLIAVFWDGIIIRIAPKYVLKNAVEVRIAQLQERFSEDPLRMVLNMLEPGGMYTADVSLDTVNPVLGSVHYDLEVQTNGLDHYLFTQGTASSQETMLDMALFVSPDCMAVSSRQLVEGAYYGLTFDTFRQDLQSIPLLDFFITEKMIAQWESDLQTIRTQMTQVPVLKPFPEISETETEALLLGLLAMPCEVEEVSVSDGDSLVKCRGLSYRVRADEINRIFENDLLIDRDIVTATFYLLDESLFKIQVNVSGENRGDTLELCFGQDSDEKLRFQIIQHQADEIARTELTVSTQRSEEEYSALWQISRTGEEDTSFGYTYRPTTGEIILTNESKQETARFWMQERENGFWMESENFSQLLRVFFPEIQAKDAVSGAALITKGSDITVPEYKNLNEWALEDFWTLLTGLGSLFGISIAS